MDGRAKTYKENLSRVARMLAQQFSNSRVVRVSQNSIDIKIMCYLHLWNVQLIYYSFRLKGAVIRPLI